MNSCGPVVFMRGRVIHFPGKAYKDTPFFKSSGERKIRQQNRGLVWGETSAFGRPGGRTLGGSAPL